MKIAVTYENGQIFQHFGHTQAFKIYEITDGQISRAEVVDTNGSGHGALAGFLMQRGVDTLICGGIGVGVPAHTAVEADAGPGQGHGEGHTCGHHGEGHTCGNHGCH